MPSKVKILIRRAKNLPIMDRKTKLTDAYVEVRLGTGYFGKTPLQPHTLNPVWKKVITFQVSEDKTLVTDPLEIKVFDKDVVSDNIIGIVYLDLSTLLYPCPAPSFVPTGLASPRLAAPFRTTPDKRVSRDIPVQPGSGGSSSSGGSLAGSTPIGIAVPTVSVTGGGGGGGSSGSNSRRGGIFTPPTKLASALFRGTAARRGGDASSGATSGEDASGCCSDAEDGEAGSGAYTQNGNNNNIINGDNINNNNNNNDGTKISGWFPIYDTLKGVQGEISITAEVRKIENKDPLAELSVGVMFFSTSTPPGIERVVGLVGACKIADDPEYQWADTFRLSRTSNEVRQVLMYKLAGRLRKKLSVQAHNLGCNAVIGYRQCIELEGTMGLVARGYGTAAVVVPYAELRDSDSASALDPADAFHSPITFPASLPAATTATTATAWSTGSGSVPAPQTLSSSLKSGNGFPLSVSQSQVQQQGSQTSQQQQQQQQQQQPQLSKSQQQQAMIQNIPLLSSRMVRLMKKTDSANSKIRSKWWDEIRNEVRRHANSIGCTHVIGYIEEVAAQDFEELTVMSGVGTAVTISPQFAKKYSSPKPDIGYIYKAANLVHPCRACHIPYASTSKLPFQTQLTRCCICRRKYVPEVILSTAEIPAGVAVSGTGEFIQARTVLPRKHGVGKAAANSISSNLPFLEYELHRQLTLKLGIMGMNAVFALNYELEVGMNALVGVATGTAVYLRALPPPKLAFKKEKDPLKEAYEFNKSRFEELIRDDEYSHRQPLQKSISALSFSSISPSSTSKPINMAPATARATSTSIPKANAIRQGLLTRPVAVATTAAPQASSSDNEDEDNGDYVGTITSTESGATERKKGKASESKKKKGKSGKKDARRHKKKKKAKTGKSSKAKHRRGSGTSSSDGNSNGNSSDDDDNNSDSSSSSSASDSDSDSSNSGGESGNVSGDCDFPNDKSSNGDENDSGNNNNSNNNNNGSIVEGTVGSGSGLLPGELESPDLRAAELQGWGEEEEEEEGAYTSPEIGADVPVFLGSLKQPYVLSLPELIENDPGMCDGRYVPENVHLCTTETLPGGWALGSDSKLVVLARRTHWRSHFSMRSMELGRTLDDVVSSAVFNSCRDSTPCCISALKVRVDMVESRDAQVVLTAVCTPLVDPEASSKYSTGGCDPQAFQLDDAFPASSTASTRSSSQQQHHHHNSHSHAIGHNQQQQQQQQQPQGVIITALTSLPHKVITRYLGFVNMHIVRESFTLRNELGKEGFTTDIFVDMFAILRARVSAMNGNALIGFNMNIFHFKSSTQKDQGYCLVSLTGDAVKYRDA